MITIERQGGGKGKARRNIQILFGWKPVLMGAEEDAGHQRTHVVDLRWRRPVEVLVLVELIGWKPYLIGWLGLIKHAAQRYIVHVAAQSAI